MKKLARITVRETSGIRRFLYPLSAPMQSTKSVLVSDADGLLLPSDAAIEGRVDFAVSLAPYEERTLFVVETEEAAAIPDPMRLVFDEKAGLTSRQERVSFHIGSQTGLDSVVYDGAEHLAGPLEIALRDRPSQAPCRLSGPCVGNLGLAASVTLCQAGLAAATDSSTEFDLTACKSWVTVTHRMHNVHEGVVTFTLPLVVLDDPPTCDFGVGNGAYEKIAGDAVVWTTDFAEKPFARWKIASIADNQERIDYEGETSTADEFAGQAWFHFTERAKALAAAIRTIPPSCRRLTVSLGRSGKIDISFTMPRSAVERADFSICYHFLNDIAAIAAATNPASILLPPIVQISPLA